MVDQEFNYRGHKVIARYTNDRVVSSFVVRHDGYVVYSNSHRAIRRMVDVIEKGEPAIMVCHWPGIYYNGEEIGFNIFKEVVTRLHAKYDHLIWMKLSEISRYWAARELTGIDHIGEKVEFNAPYACPEFTFRVARPHGKRPVLNAGPDQSAPEQTRTLLKLESNRWCSEGTDAAICIDLPKGASRLTWV